MTEQVRCQSAFVESRDAQIDVSGWRINSYSFVIIKAWMTLNGMMVVI